MDEIKQTNMATINVDDNISIPISFKKQIENQYVVPYFKKKLSKCIHAEAYWHKVATRTAIIAKIIALIGSILAFAVTSFQHLTWLGYLAGSCGVISLSLAQYAEFALKHAVTSITEANDLLKSIGLTVLPDIDSISLNLIQNNN